nr:reverse transcriptase domain-containing protein [Tanacetum cinerariifolium]
MPFFLTYGTEAVILVVIGMPTLRTVEVDMIKNDDALEINLDLLEERKEHVAIQEAKSKARMEKYYNTRVRNTSFRPGDLVYRNNEVSHAKDGGKLRPKCERPYEVTKALGKGSYKLRDRDGNALPRTWNVCNLKKCYVHEMLCHEMEMEMENSEFDLKMACKAFSWFSAVYGGTYMLNKPECKVEFDEKGKVYSVTSEGEKLSARKLFVILHICLASDMFVFLFAITNCEPFEVMETPSYCLAHSETTVARMLVGNKCDLDNIRAVSVEDGKNLVKKHGLFFMETLALDSTNVKTAFEMDIKEIYGNEYSRKRRKQSPKRQNQTLNGKDRERQSQSPRSTKVNLGKVKINPDKAEVEKTKKIHFKGLKLPSP